MITRDMKISRMLDEYPGSLQVLIAVSPHFRKLENKMLRKALAGRVTVEQAAKVAGVDPDYLLSELNRSALGSAALSVEAEEAKPAEVTPEAREEKPVFLRSHKKTVTLDVRPILDSGKDPLKDIFSHAKELKKGEVLLILNSFEPVPLYSRMKDMGFSHWTENEAGLWKIYFYKETEVKKEAEEALPAAAGTINIGDYESVIEVDVHDLPAPEPMVKILENLSRIDDRSVMLVHHHREPNLLYPRLEERGFVAQCTKLGEESYQILIAKKKKS